MRRSLDRCAGADIVRILSPLIGRDFQNIKPAKSWNRSFCGWHDKVLALFVGVGSDYDTAKARVGVKEMRVSISDLGNMGITEVIVESVDLSLYIAHARIAGQEHVIADCKGNVLKTRNLLEMQRMLRRAVTCEFFLRQRSAYDEMVGHAHQAVDNMMELPLRREPSPEWLN